MALHDGFGDNNFHLCDCGSGFFTPDNGKYQIARVKFGVPLEEVFKNDIPGPLLVLILKLNKQAPYKKDIFRAPGHLGNVKKLIHFLQNGRLVNIDNFSVYTIASVIKKFLRKVPNGIFGKSGEEKLFRMIEMDSIDERRDQIYSLISSMPLTTQRLIVLLFGTFRIVATNAERSDTGMTAEALGVSVAPSFFQSCVSDGTTAKMEDVLRYKVATKIMKFLIENFGVSNLFGRENYEYYARITGRILKVDEDWIVTFRNPPSDGIGSPMTQHEDSHSTPELMRASIDTDGIEDFDCSCSEPSASLTIIPETNHHVSYTRLSISLEDSEVFKDTFGDSPDWPNSGGGGRGLALDEVRAVNHFAERAKSLMVLPQVYERQVARMKTRSDWFLSPSSTSTKSALVEADQSASSNQIFISREEPSVHRQPGGLFNLKTDSLKQLVRRGSFEEKQRRLVRRTSSKKKNKENGTNSTVNTKSSGVITTAAPSAGTWSTFPVSSLPGSNSSDNTNVVIPNVDPRLGDICPVVTYDYSNSLALNTTADLGTEDSSRVPVVVQREGSDVFSKESPPETDVQTTFQMSLTYKPRI